jgi:hypothetical protein
MQAITEKDSKDIIAQWYAEAKEQTVDTLPGFIARLTTEYGHDYGTIVHAITAAAVGAAWAVEHSPAGGITGFQGGAVMWEFMRHWNGVEAPARLVRYEEMLYPQYAYKFEKTINAATWAHLQERAKAKLAERDVMHPDVLAHMQSIVNGVVPFGYTISDD